MCCECVRSGDHILLSLLMAFLFTCQKENYIGDLMFSLAYLPAAERLTIVVMKARNLIGVGIDKKTPPGNSKFNRGFRFKKILNFRNGKILNF